MAVSIFSYIFGPNRFTVQICEVRTLLSSACCSCVGPYLHRPIGELWVAGRIWRRKFNVSTSLDTARPAQLMSSDFECDRCHRPQATPVRSICICIEHRNSSNWALTSGLLSNAALSLLRYRITDGSRTVVSSRARNIWHPPKCPSHDSLKNNTAHDSQMSRANNSFKK